MDNEKKCLRCGGTNLVDGDVQSTGKVYARPKNAKLTAVLTSGAPLEAKICTDCGYTELAVSPEQIKKILKG